MTAKAKTVLEEMRSLNRRILVAAVTTILLVVLAWEIAYDINDPTIPVVRELLFTAGSILGIAAWFYCLLGER